MRLTISRLATGVAAILLALATVSVSTAYADDYFDDYGGEYEDPIPTTCGAGTAEFCANKPITSCDWEIEVGIDPVTKRFNFKLVRKNCRITGHTPIYKDHAQIDPNIFKCTKNDPMLPGTGVCVE
jgi:hypothetical protein